MTKPLIVSTNRHAVAAAIYTFELLLSLFLVSGVADPIRQIVAWHGEEWARVWALVLFIGAAHALSSMFKQEPMDACITERRASCIISVAMGYLLVAVSVDGSFSIVGISLIGGFCVASIVRAIQTHREVKLVRKSRSNPKVVDGTYLAEAEQTTT
jgi:hypothetical protein